MLFVCVCCKCACVLFGMYCDVGWFVVVVVCVSLHVPECAVFDSGVCVLCL